MKRLLFVLILGLTFHICAQDTTFSKIYENTQFSDVQPVTAAVALDGGLVTVSKNLAEGNVILLRTSPNGMYSWEKSFDGPSSPNGLFINDIAATSDTCYLLSGLVFGTGSEYFPICMKVNDQGDFLWMKNFDFNTPTTGNYDKITDANPYVCEASDSSILMAWHHSPSISSTPDQLCVSKISLDGNLMWTNSFVVDSTFYVADIVENHDQSISVLGNTDYQYGSGYVVHLSDSGTFDWAKLYQDVVFDEIIEDSNGFAVSWMNLNEQSTGVMKFDALGTNIKRINHSGWNSEVFPSFTQRDNGNYVFTQRGDNFGGGLLFELNDNLDFVGSKTMYLVVQSVRNIPNYGSYAVGYGPMYGVKTAFSEVAVIRFDSLMNDNQLCTWPDPYAILNDSTIVGESTSFSIGDSISEFQTSMNSGFTSSVVNDDCVTFFGSVDEIEGTWNETVSPNPSFGEFTIEWEGYRDTEVIIYNAIGMEILRSKAKDSFITFNLEEEKSGIYHYRLVDADGKWSNGRFVLSK
ncbi:MAG: T9SS type A sorting domain-containing protein [Crocinitomicaceae bacterium]